METPFKDESPLDGPSDSIYRVLTLMVKAYINSSERRNPLNGPSDLLYSVLTLIVKAYKETLLKDESPPDGPSDSLYRVRTLTAKAYRETLERQVLLMALLTAYIGSSPRRLRPTRRLS